MSATGGPLELLRRFSQHLRRLTVWVVVMAFGLLLVLSISQALLRNTGQSVPVWMDPLSHRLVLWVGLLGGILAVSAHSHIKLDVASQLLPASVRGWVQRGMSLFSAGVCVLLAKASLTFVQDEAALSDATLAGVPSWIFAAIIPFSFVGMGLQFVLEALVPTEPEGVSPQVRAQLERWSHASDPQDEAHKQAERGVSRGEGPS